jgi:hypothetical protein
MVLMSGSLIASFTASGGLCPGEERCVRARRGAQVKLQWSLSAPVDDLRLNGKALSPADTEAVVTAEVDTVHVLAAANASGAEEAQFFVDVVDPGELISAHVLLGAGDAAPGLAAAAATSAVGAPGTIHARLMSGGSPLAGTPYTVWLGDRQLTGTTGPDGVLQHADVPVGFYAVEAGGERGLVEAIAGAGPSVAWLGGGAGATTTAPAASGSGEDWDGEPHNGEVHAQLFLRGTLQPLANATYRVWVGDDDVSGRTDGQGILRESLPMGYYPIDVDGKRGFVTSAAPDNDERPAAVWLTARS